MLSMNDLKPGVTFLLDGDPYLILDAKHLMLGRGGSVLQTRLKNLRRGTVLERNFKQADTFEEASVEKKPVVFIYAHRDEYWFHEKGKPQARFKLPEALVAEARQWLKPNLEAEAFMIDEKILTIVLPIKLDLLVKEAPPGVKGDTAQGGVKTVVLETGAKVNVPLFINARDVIRVNTETGEYVERVAKAKS
ncbi:elongation factor P [Candidatus Azambacteria bacterium]|nr:elongation factor P [Candidatus Azambacteria bacterium]